MGDGKMQPLTQVCSPHSLKVACTCAGGTKGPFSVTSLGPALAPPVSEQPRCLRSLCTVRLPRPARRNSPTTRFV